MRRTVLVLVCAVGIIAGVVGPVTAAFAATTVTWTGPSGGYWSTASNWSPAAPQAGDDLVFPAPATSGYSSAANDTTGGTFNSLTVSGNWALSGQPITLSGGVSVLGPSSSANVNIPITVASAQTFDLRGAATATFNAVTLNANLDVDAGGWSYLTLAAGTGTLTKSGSGTLMLGGSPTGAGQIVLNQGSLLVSGSFAQRTLSMTGGQLSFQGSAAGTSLGAVSATGGEIMGTGYCGSCLPRAVVNGLTLGSGATVGGGTTTVAGTVALNSPAIDPSVLPGSPGATLVLIDNDGTDPVVGTFAGRPEGAIVALGGHLARVSYVGGTGNDVTLTNVDPLYVYAVTTANHLIRFDATSPGTLLRDVPVTGVGAGESILSIDFRTATGQLYGLGSSSRLYVLNQVTGAAMAVGSTTFTPKLTGGAFAMEFDGKDDRIQVVSDTGQNLRLNPNTGAVIAVNAPLAFSINDVNHGTSPHITALAAYPYYSSSFVAIDSSLDSTVSMNGPTLQTMSALGLDTSSLTGADFFAWPTPFYSSGDVYANLTVGSTPQLWLLQGYSSPSQLVGVIGAPGVRDIAIAPAGQLQFGSASYSVGESGGTITIPVTRTKGSSGPVTVDFDTILGSGTATGDVDYASTAGTLSFADGQTSKNIVIPILDDTAVEGDETFDVTLSNPTGGAALGAVATTTVTILDNDATAPPTLVIDDVTVAEGNSGTTAATFTVTLSRPSAQPISVNFATADGTAVAPGDYHAANGPVVFNPGQTSQLVTILVNGDTTAEPNESFTVNLASPSGATIADAQGVGTISNDDPPGISINDVSIIEGNSGTKTLLFTITLSQPASQNVTFNVATANGTATAPSDYVAKSVTGKTIVAGATTATTSITINGDTTIEPNETFTVTLSNIVGAVATKATGTGTITNDD